jgi:hypothetical protein
MAVYGVVTDAGTVTLINVHLPGDPENPGSAPGGPVDAETADDGGDRQLRYMAAVRPEYVTHAAVHPTVLVGDWNFGPSPGTGRVHRHSLGGMLRRCAPLRGALHPLAS